MGTISAIGSSAGAWPATASPGRMKEQLFAKVDADGSGGVDKTELQGLLDKVSGKSGMAAGGAEELFAGIDSDGNGSLSAGELDEGMKSLMPAPSDTLAFAQSRGAADGPRSPPPAAGASSGSSGSAATTTDPLDTNQDGTVSALERAAGELAEMMKTLKQCEQTAANLSTQESSATLRVAA